MVVEVFVPLLLVATIVMIVSLFTAGGGSFTIGSIMSVIIGITITLLVVVPITSQVISMSNVSSSTLAQAFNATPQVQDVQEVQKPIDIKPITDVKMQCDASGRICKSTR